MSETDDIISLPRSRLRQIISLALGYQIETQADHDETLENLMKDAETDR